MRNDELIERIENLEIKLKEEIRSRESLQKTLNETKEVLDFIIERGKDGVAIKHRFYYCVDTYVICYIYANSVKNCETMLSTENEIKIVKTDERSIIFVYANEYYKIDKATSKYMSIPKPAFVTEECDEIKE